MWRRVADKVLMVKTKTVKIEEKIMFGYNPEDYEIRTELATCCNGIASVYLAKHTSGQLVAMKKFRMDKAKEESAAIRDEILIMRQFNHPNILSFFTAFVDNFDVFVIAPFMPFGSCRDTMTQCCVTGLPEVVVVLILKDVLHGLEYLHKKGFIHRAIRASHILLTHDRAVITGFRQAISLLSHGERVRSLHNLPASTKGLNWLAPELLEQDLLGYTEKSDVYSVGITTCELCNGIEPFANMPTTFMLTEKIRGNQPTLLDFSTCPTEDMVVQAIDPSDTFMAQTRQIYSQKKLSDNIHKFAEVCMQRQPSDRPSVWQLFNHPALKQTKHTSLSEQLSNFGIQAVDYSQHCDENLKLVQELSDMNLAGSAFEWDF